MSLVLHLTTKDPALSSEAPRRIEVAQRLTIGRGPGNDLMLDDPNRYLSKNHCVIDANAGGYTVTDTSGNGVFLNDNPERLPRNAPVPLVEGNVLRLGPYEITVATIAPSPSGRQSPMDATAGQPGGIFSDPLAELDDAATGKAPVSQPAHGVESLDGLSAASPSSPSLGPLIPDDVDLLGGAPRDDGWRGGSQPDHAPSDQAFFALPKAFTEKIPEDWEMSVASAPLGADAAVHVSEEPAFPTPGVVKFTPKVGAASQAGGDSAALASFLAATGLSGTTLSDAEKVRLMQLAGTTLAAMVKGLMEILAARASTKQEFRIERTTIGAGDNNPLKFSGDAEQALQIMLLGRMPGFLPAKAAVEEAFGDIKSHHLAVLAGMQLALKTIIARFDPGRLEQRLAQGSLIEGILPAARKARNWELFRLLYKEIATELDEDFQKVFGAEFARAYKEQLD